jgi:hypothetical protein
MKLAISVMGWLLLTALLGNAPQVTAQQSAVTVQGFIHDQDARPVPVAQVLAILTDSTGNATSISVAADDSGYYQLRLKPGRWHLTVRMICYPATTPVLLELQLGVRVVQDLTLPPKLEEPRLCRESDSIQLQPNPGMQPTGRIGAEHRSGGALGERL